MLLVEKTCSWEHSEINFHSHMTSIRFWRFLIWSMLTLSLLLLLNVLYKAGTSNLTPEVAVGAYRNCRSNKMSTCPLHLLWKITYWCSEAHLWSWVLGELSQQQMDYPNHNRSELRYLTGQWAHADAVISLIPTRAAKRWGLCCPPIFACQSRWHRRCNHHVKS